ncbi:MAG: thioredoxin family protein [Thermoleophilia bacterium]
MLVQILGTGCKKCDELYARAREAVQNIEGAQAGGAQALEVEKSDDIDIFLQYGVRVTPALVVGGELVSMGTLLTVEEIEQAIRERGGGRE